MRSNHPVIQAHSRSRILTRRSLIGAAVAGSASAVTGMALARPQAITEGDILGPFHRPGAPYGAMLVDEAELGERLRVHGQVFGSDRETPIADAVLDIWQADATGAYDQPDYVNVVKVSDSYRLRRQIRTDAEGRYAFETIIPGRYAIPPGLPGFESFAGQTRPAHIHLIAIQPGYEPLVTQLYFDGDPDIRDDPWAHDSANVLAMVPVEAARQTVASSFDILLARA